MRRKIRNIVIALGSVVLIPVISTAQCTLQKEGIYVARVDSNTNAYLKFFNEDSVLTTTSNIPRSMSDEYINKQNKKLILHGTYKQKGCFIKMEVSGIMGAAKLEGYFIENNIGLSKINLQNSTYTDLFFFYKEPEY